MSQPQPYGSFPPPPPPPQASSRRGLLFLGVALGVVLSLVVGAVLAATSVLSLTSSSPSSSSAASERDGRPITLPETIGPVRDFVAVSRDIDPIRGPKSADSQNRTRERTEREFERAFPGAGVAAGTYGDKTLMFLVTVVAVRASAPGLTWGPDVDPVDTGLRHPQTVLITKGATECITKPQPGISADPGEVTTTQCRRSGPQATVYAYGNAEGQEGQDMMVATTDAAYTSVFG